MILLGAEVISLLASYRSRKRGRFEEVALLTGLLLCPSRSRRFEILVLPAERTSCIFPHGIT